MALAVGFLTGLGLSEAFVYAFDVKSAAAAFVIGFVTTAATTSLSFSLLD